MNSTVSVGGVKDGSSMSPVNVMGASSCATTMTSVVGDRGVKGYLGTLRCILVPAGRRGIGAVPYRDCDLVGYCVPSDSARVNSTGVSSETLGAVKDGSSMSPVNVMESVELCDQAYVRVSSVSRSVTVASRVTTEPSAASWSAPASTVGGALALSRIVTVTLSDTVSVPSDSPG